jgi:hypothetical protein
MTCLFCYGEDKSLLRSRLLLRVRSAKKVLLRPRNTRKAFGGRRLLGCDEMMDPEFDVFLAERVDAFERKQAALTERFGLGTHARWDYDQTTGTLVFSDAAGRVVVEADVAPIGSWSAAGPNFRWAWANPSFPEPARTRATRLRGCTRRRTGWSASTQRCSSVRKRRLGNWRP